MTWPIATPTTRPTSCTQHISSFSWCGHGRQRSHVPCRFGKMFRRSTGAVFFIWLLATLLRCYYTLINTHRRTAPPPVSATPMVAVVLLIVSSFFFVFTLWGTSHSLCGLEWYMHGRLGCEVWRAKRGNPHIQRAACLHIRGRRPLAKVVYGCSMLDEFMKYWCT